MNNSTIYTLNLYERHHPVTALLEQFAPAGPLAERVIPPIWYAIGFIGNPISAVVWLGQRMRRNNSSAIYLGALSISDMLFLFLHLLMVLHTAWGYDIYNNHIACEIFYFLYYIPQYLSTFLVLGFTSERYVAVCHPFLKEKLCTVRRAVVIVLCLTAFAVTLSTAQIYIWEYSVNISTCTYRAEAVFNEEMSFQNIWTWVTDIFAFVLVPLIVLVFNILVLKEIFKISRNDLMRRQQSRSGNSAASTMTLLAVSFYLIITQLCASVLHIMQNAFPVGDIFLSDDEVRNDRTWSKLFTFLEVKKVVEVILLSHYACYFFIYCLTGKHFRREVLYLMTLQGKVSVLSRILSKKRRQEQYSMMSTNGGHNSETYVTTFSTTM